MYIRRYFSKIILIENKYLIIVFYRNKFFGRIYTPGPLANFLHALFQCQGLGELVDPDLQCTKCAGKRVSRGKTVLEVGVERGMADGHRIVFDHEGDQASGVESGDIVVVLHEQKHDTFQRKFSDLITVVKV